MAGIGFTPCRSTVAENIRVLQRWVRHASRTSGGRLGLLQLARDGIERAHDLADRLGGDAGIERRGIELGVAEQHLDHSDIDVLFQKMGGKAVPECVRRYPLVDPGHVGSRMAGAMELARGERTDGVLTGKQPPSWPTRLAPSPQQLEQMRRQHDVSVFATLALLDPDHHALAVDVGYLQCHYLRYAQSRPVGHTQSRLVLTPQRRIEEARHLVWTEDDR